MKVTVIPNNLKHFQIDILGIIFEIIVFREAGFVILVNETNELRRMSLK